MGLVWVRGLLLWFGDSFVLVVVFASGLETVRAFSMFLDLLLLCFFPIQRLYVVFCKHVRDRTQTRYMFCAVFFLVFV